MADGVNKELLRRPPFFGVFGDNGDFDALGDLDFLADVVALADCGSLADTDALDTDGVRILAIVGKDKLAASDRLSEWSDLIVSFNSV